MIDIMNINIYVGLLFLGFLIKITILYKNYYKIYKNLDIDERIKFFSNKYIIAIISKFNIVKNIFIFFILIPIIKINYFILSILISLIHSLCEIEYDNFMEQNGFSFSKFSYDEIDKILNNSDEEKNDNENYNILKYNDNDKEKQIDNKIEFYMKNINNIIKLDHNEEDYRILKNIINDNDFDFNTNINIDELKKDVNIINEGIEVLKIDDIDFGENLNTFFNNFNKEKITNNTERNINNNSENIVIIKTGKKKLNKN
jgi:hypothetical protein